MSGNEQLEELMTGVKLISKEEETFVTAITKKSSLLVVVSRCITIIVAIVQLFALFCTDNLLFLVGFLVIVGILIANLLTERPLIISEVGTGEFIYTVKVDDTVSFNAFYSKYEILDKDEDVYTLKEKKWGH